MRQLGTNGREHATNVMRGVLMGAADIVPGVSGGTIALVLGIYERWVTAISHFDIRLLSLLRQRRWRDATIRVDLTFLVSLAVGILAGMAIMTMLMNHLLTNDHTRSLTLAAFFGLILASGVLVATLIKATGRGEVAGALVAGVLGVCIAVWLTGLTASNTAQPGLLYVFLCGAVAICAMILPGISGAMILLILGIYVYLTATPHDLLHGKNVLTASSTLIVFAAGCASGLVTFSKSLRWLLKHHHRLTMAVLCGFMFGSLRKLWPFQQDLTPHVAEVKLKSYQLVLPTEFNLHVVQVIAIIIMAGMTVLAMDYIGKRRAAAS